MIPVTHPKADGKPGHARISITGFDAPRPSVVVRYTERNGTKGDVRLDIPKIAVDRPQTTAATVRAGRDGVDRLDLRVKVDTEKDEHEALIKRTDETRVDRTMMSAEQARAVFAYLNRLRANGVYRDALAYHDLGAVRVTIGWEHESKPGTEVVATLDANGSPAPFPDIKTYEAPLRAEARPDRERAQAGALPTDRARALAADGPPAFQATRAPLVQWDTPIPPPEAYAILAKMSGSHVRQIFGRIPLSG